VRADALRAGVRAVLPRAAAPAEIIAAIEAVAAGLVVLHPDGLEALPPRPAGAAPPSASEADQPLTARETEVLAMLAEGLGNKLIAARLGISEHTVKFHVASIFAKLGAGTRTEAVTIGVRRGLIMI
ncbi:MAG: response regulator transcription factor, partial [Burkholderiales bacterium]